MTDTLLIPETPSTPYPLRLALAEQAEVTSVMRRSGGGPTRMRIPGATDEIRPRVLMTDAGFFDFFSFPLISGAPQPLADLSGLVLTPETAQMLFGDADAVGQVVEVFKPWPTPTWVPLTVTAIAARAACALDDRVWRRRPLRGAARRLRRPRQMGHEQLPQLRPPRARRRRSRLRCRTSSRIQAVDPISDMWSGRRFAALPMTDFYLSGIEESSAFTGKAGYMKLFGAIALVILLIAILNYVNLATASGMRMAREVGVRKAVGSGRGQVARGLLVEALLLVGLSFALSVGLVLLATPLVNSFFDKGIVLGWDALPVWAGAFGLMLVVGIVAGAYPALVLSRFSPARVLKSGPQGAVGGTWLRRGLVVTQFAATIGLLIFTASVFRQLDHVESRYPMPDDSRLAVLSLEREWGKRSATVEQALAELPGVIGTAASTGVPGQIGNRYGFLPDGPDADFDIIAGFFGDRDFADLLGLPTAHRIGQLVGSRRLATVRQRSGDAALGVGLVARRGFPRWRGRERRQRKRVDRAGGRADGFSLRVAARSDCAAVLRRSAGHVALSLRRLARGERQRRRVWGRASGRLVAVQQQRA